MNLERFRRNKMIVLNQQSMAYQAARAMEDNHIGAVLVSGPQGLAGIVTDRDLALTVLGGDLDPHTTTLNEIMSEDVIACDVGATLDDVARLMQEYRVRRIPITDNGRLAGLITFDDLVVEGSTNIESLRAIVSNPCVQLSRHSSKLKHLRNPRGYSTRRGPSERSNVLRGEPAL